MNKKLDEQILRRYRSMINRCYNGRLKYPVFMSGGWAPYTPNSYKKFEAWVYRELDRLGLDTLDGYVLVRPDPLKDFAPTNCAIVPMHERNRYSIRNVLDVRKVKRIKSVMSYAPHVTTRTVLSKTSLPERCRHAISGLIYGGNWAWVNRNTVE